MKTIDKLIEFHKWTWDELNLFGKFVFYPLLLIISPIILLIILSMKDDKYDI